MAAFVVDDIGSWSYIVVISVYIFDRTHSTQWLAANAACRWGPSLLLASYGGVLADRYQRTTVMVISALASAVLMTGMAVAVASAAPVGYLLVISAVSSVALAPYQPAAGALTPEIVGEQDLSAANSIFSALQSLVVVVGPGIGGLLLLTGRPVMGRRGCAGETGRTAIGGIVTQCPATVAERITRRTAREKGDKLMTPGRTSGANSARREER